MSASLNDQEQTFVLWHATPKGSREPTNFKELCKSLHISQATGYRWLKRPNIQASIDSMVKEAVGGPDRIMALVDSLYAVATSDAKDRVNAATLFMRYAGVLVDKITVNPSAGTDIEQMSDEELGAALEEMQMRRARRVLAVK
jgi:hypothetical protein